MFIARLSLLCLPQFCYVRMGFFPILFFVKFLDMFLPLFETLLLIQNGKRTWTTFPLCRRTGPASPPSEIRRARRTTAAAEATRRPSTGKVSFVSLLERKVQFSFLMERVIGIAFIKENPNIYFPRYFHFSAKSRPTSKDLRTSHFRPRFDCGQNITFFRGQGIIAVFRGVELGPG